MNGPPALPPPRKRFGQHFLHDPAIIDRIVTAIGPRADRRLVEIGPGRGALTRALLRSVPQLDVVEIDRDLAARLPALLDTTSERLRVHCVDALAFDLGALTPPHQTIDVVGNLPYNISSPLLFHLLDQVDRIGIMVFMLQKEVVERIAAAPGGRDYGRLSVMIQHLCRVEHLFNVGPGAFTPPPKVDSAVVRLTPFAASERIEVDRGVLTELVRRAFSMRRKTLRNNLRDFCPPLLLEAAEIDPRRRAETLTVAEFVRLARMKCEWRNRLM